MAQKEKSQQTAVVRVSSGVDCNTRIYGVSLLNRILRILRNIGYDKIYVDNPDNHSLKIDRCFLELILSEEPKSKDILLETKNIYNQNFLAKNLSDPESSIILTVENQDDIKRCKKILGNLSRKAVCSGIDKYWFDWPSNELAKLISPSPVTPNQVTFMGLVIAVISLLFFARGTWESVIVGAVLVHVGFIFDCIDGRLARLKGISSQFGGFFDAVLDSVEANLWMLGISLALFANQEYTFALFGLAALIGESLSSIISSVAEKYYGGDDSAEAKNKKGSVLRLVLVCFRFLSQYDVKLYLILIFALLNRLDILVVLFAVLFNIRWIYLTFTQWRRS